MSRFRLTLAICACALFALPAVASARPHVRSWHGTFPYASRLCQRAARDKLGPKLKGDQSQVLAACSTLRGAYATQAANLVNEYSSLRQQALQIRATVKSTCITDRANHDKAGCKAARQQGRSQIKALRAQLRSDGASYVAAIQSARTAFWTTIRGLAGGSTVTPDTGSVPAPNLPGLPSV